MLKLISFFLLCFFFLSSLPKQFPFLSSFHSSPNYSPSRSPHHREVFASFPKKLIKTTTGVPQRRLVERTPEIEKVIQEYESQLKDPNICENSFLNSFLKINVQNTQQVPVDYDDSKDGLGLCPDMKKTCCSKKIFEFYYEEHRRYYSDQLMQIPQLDKFLTFLSRVDDVVINHIIRKKDDYNGECFPKDDSELRRLWRHIKTQKKPIIKSFFEFVINKLSYSIHQLCHLCDPVRQSFFKIDLIEELYEITLNAQETINYLSQSQEYYDFFKFRSFVNFLQCIHHKTKFDKRNKFYLRELEDQPNYNSLLQNLTLLFDQDQDRQHFYNNYAMTADRQINLENTADATLDLFLFKTEEYDMSMFRAVHSQQTDENLKVFAPETAHFKIGNEGFLYNESKIGKTEMSLVRNFMLLYEDYFKSAAILRVFSLVMVIFL